MKKRGKRYNEALEKFEKSKLYSKEEAVKLVKETSNAKFDATIEVAMYLNLDTKGDAQKAAREAGADYVGDIDMVEKIEKENWFDFDTLIATPDAMPLLGKLGRVLGPKGLMPNPKTGTVTTDVAKAINDVKSGRIEYRTDSFGNIHCIIGKASFEEEKLLENLNTFVSTILKLKPATVKGDYVKNISVSSTMGPGIKINVNSFDK